MSDMPPERLSAVRPGVSRRVAWLVVSIMTALIVLALAGVVWGFIRNYRIYMSHHAGAAPLASSSAPAAVLTLAPGAHIVSAATDAGKLVLPPANLQFQSAGPPPDQEVEITVPTVSYITPMFGEPGRYAAEFWSGDRLLAQVRLRVEAQAPGAAGPTPN